ncbi:DUF742 domain-containing protein [Streptomyces sp. DH8]|uniref:DUF742 domain-containing protein n=1 Tax=unclassified Streptomyces TaxID=2593676 RepID=UPI001E4CDA37|nr:DUF742 domain-containing protein [Streptomyces sp. DH8]
MAAPTGGHPYNGDQSVPGEHGDNRFGFPAVPDGQGSGQYQPYQQPQQAQGGHGAPGSEWPPQQPGAGWPQQQRYDAPRQPHIQPVQQRQAPEPAKPAAHNPLVRPYAMTGGRTRPRYQLAIEALVSTTADPSRLQGQLPEHQRICRLCIEIKSVAEISALLSIPLGVARILVADLAEAGLVAIHQPGGDEAAGGQPDVTLLERVLSGLRKL